MTGPPQEEARIQQPGWGTARASGARHLYPCQAPRQLEMQFWDTTVITGTPRDGREVRANAEQCQQADRSQEAHESSPFKFQDKSEGDDECRPAQALEREQIPGPGRQGDGSQGMMSGHPRDSAYIYRRTGTSTQGTLFAAHTVGRSQKARQGWMCCQPGWGTWGPDRSTPCLSSAPSHPAL